ncbi:MAG TPA: FHA domain-containing protein [Candidatus Acidoferrales bacterium]|nr:FHA domain-containing protein [Candidatus Acidoferrales bacterium]
MAKLVILSQSMNGRVHELKADKTTIGRVEDNTFQIAEPSVSSHHCEVLLRGNEVVIKDLNSTNGTFINDEKVTESVLKPGQTLRLGQIELRLENGAPAAPAPAPAASPAASAPPPAKKPESVTRAATRGVSLSELETGGRPPGGDTASVFTKKRNKVGTYFWIAVVVVAIIIIGLLFYALSLANTHNH